MCAWADVPSSAWLATHEGHASSYLIVFQLAVSVGTVVPELADSHLLG